MKEWFDAIDKENVELHPLSIGSGLESLLKDAPKDETLRRFCQPGKSMYLNPEEANTVEKEFGPQDEQEEDDDDDKN